MIAHFLLRKTLFWNLFRKLRGGGVDTFKSLKFGVRQIKKWEVGRAFQPCVRTRGRLAMVGMEPAGRWMCGVGGGRCRRVARAGEGALREWGWSCETWGFRIDKRYFLSRRYFWPRLERESLRDFSGGESWPRLQPPLGVLSSSVLSSLPAGALPFGLSQVKASSTLSFCPG